MPKYKYGTKSKRILTEVTWPLAHIFERSLELSLIDIALTEGRRDRAKQNRLFDMGLSKVRFPNSKHNTMEPFGLVTAIDAYPYVNGQISHDYRHCIYLAGIITAVGRLFNYHIRWGGNWDMDGEPVTDQEFQDLGHYEYVGWEGSEGEII